MGMIMLKYNGIDEDGKMTPVVRLDSTGTKDELMKRIPTHPGVLLKQEVMKSFNLKNNFIYKDSSETSDYWKSAFKGESPITEDMAYELSDKLNISFEFWIDMQRNRDEAVS